MPAKQDFIGIVREFAERLRSGDCKDHQWFWRTEAKAAKNQPDMTAGMLANAVEIAVEALEIAACRQHVRSCRAHPDFISDEGNKDCCCPQLLVVNALNRLRSLSPDR